MNDIAVIKATEHVNDGINVADVGQKLVTQAFTLGGTAYETGNVHEFNGSRCIELRIIHFRQYVQTTIRHGYHAHVGIDGAEGIVGADGTGACNSIKQSTLAYVRQADNSKFHKNPF